MSDLILHHYDASPFTQKALKMLGLKGLAWSSVITPMMPPKDDLVALTGGYRGTPVLQIGAEVFIDSQLIALELQRRHPQPSFFPGGDEGLALALVKWSDAFFRAGLHMAIALMSSAWPKEFLADREQLFGDIDFARVRTDLPHSASQLRAHATLLNRQLADGRAFLTGNAPGLADIQAFGIPWFTRAGMPDVVNELLADLEHLPAWERRVAALGEGQRTSMDARAAFAVARAAPRDFIVDVRARDSGGLTAGQTVCIAPDDTQRGAVTGQLVIARANEIAVRRTHGDCGEVLVHFPRLGYRMTAA